MKKLLELLKKYFISHKLQFNIALILTALIMIFYVKDYNNKTAYESYRMAFGLIMLYAVFVYNLKGLMQAGYLEYVAGALVNLVLFVAGSWLFVSSYPLINKIENKGNWYNVLFILSLVILLYVFMCLLFFLFKVFSNIFKKAFKSIEKIENKTSLETANKVMSLVLSLLSVLGAAFAIGSTIKQFLN